MKKKPSKMPLDAMDKLSMKLKIIIEAGDHLRNRIVYTHQMKHTNCHICDEIKSWDQSIQDV